MTWNKYEILFINSSHDIRANIHDNFTISIIIEKQFTINKM